MPILANNMMPPVIQEKKMAQPAGRAIFLLFALCLAGSR
jgi:hypothetical protein